MFDKYQGLTAKEWNRAYQAAAKSRDSVDNKFTAYVEEFQILKAKLALTENNLTASETKLRWAYDAIFKQRFTSTDTVNFWHGLTAKNWCEESEKWYKECLEKEEQLNASKADLQLEKMKYAAKCIEAAGLNTAKKLYEGRYCFNPKVHIFITTGFSGKMNMLCKNCGRLWEDQEKNPTNCSVDKVLQFMYNHTMRW